MSANRHEGQFRLAADGDDEAVRKGELGLGETGVATAHDHVAGARAHAFDVLGEVERLCQQRVSRNRAVRMPQFLPANEVFHHERLPAGSTHGVSIEFL